MFRVSVFLTGIISLVLLTIFVVLSFLHDISLGALLSIGLPGGVGVICSFTCYLYVELYRPNQPPAIVGVSAINSDIEQAEPIQREENDLRQDVSLRVDSLVRSVAEIITYRLAINSEIEQAAHIQRIVNDLRPVESQSAASFPRSMAVAPASASPFWKQNEANIQLSLTLHSRYVASESKTPIPDKYTCPIAGAGELMEDPYLAGKHNFDKASLDKLFEGGKKQTVNSPIDRAPIRYQDIRANDPLRREILEFVEECETQKRLLDKEKAAEESSRASIHGPNERTSLLTP